MFIQLKNNNIEKKLEHLESKGWKFVKVREYQNTFIFKSSDGEKYLHLGDSKKIQHIINAQDNLYKLGYPVAPILKTGSFGGFLYFIESSLGNETFGDIFAKNIKDRKFQSFCNIVTKYFEAQAKNQLPTPTGFSISKEVMAENVIQENPDLNIDMISSSVDKLQQRFQTLPFAYSHGDFAARNILNLGVIDFEFYSVLPMGLDVFTVCAVENFWMYKNNYGEFCAQFSFEKKHNERLIKILGNVCSNYNLGKLLEYQNDFILYKAIWSTAYEKQQAIKNRDDTKWRFRRAILMHCVKKYLKDEKINPIEFQDLNKI